jgi:seryl-tRNA synthetase
MQIKIEQKRKQKPNLYIIAELENKEEIIEKDPIAQNFIKKEVLHLKEKITEDQKTKVLVSKRADVIDYFRSKYHKNVKSILVNDPNGFLENIGYSVQQVNLQGVPEQKFYSLPLNLNVSIFYSKYNELISYNSNSEVTSKSEVIQKINENQKLNSSAAEIQKFLEKNQWIMRTNFGSDFVYNPNYIALDDALQKIYIRDVLKKKVEKYYFCQTVPIKDLLKLGLNRTVLQNFHYLCSPTKVMDLKIKTFLEDYMCAKQIQSRSTGSHFALNYCACNGLWPGIRNKNFISSRNLYTFYDSSVQTFRNEKGKVSSLERLQIFKRYEHVFIGTKDQIDNYICKLYNQIKTFLITLKLPCTIIKNGSWFCQDEQFKDSYTIDLEFPLTESKTLQIGNLNYNSDHWTTAYNVRVNNKNAYSGCTGIGRQRLVFAFLVTHGTDCIYWPEEITNLYLENLSNYVIE